MKRVEYNPESVIGKKYERGLLPYGGCVNSSGKITFAVSKIEFDREMEKLRSLE
jgi:hypothetical protein